MAYQNISSLFLSLFLLRFQAAVSAGRNWTGFWWVLGQASNQTGTVSPAAPLWAQLQGGELVPVSTERNRWNPPCETPNQTRVSLLQVKTLLEQVSEKLLTFSEVGISPAHADHIFSEHTAYEERVSVSKLKPCDVDDPEIISINPVILIRPRSGLLSATNHELKC